MLLLLPLSIPAPAAAEAAAADLPHSLRFVFCVILPRLTYQFFKNTLHLSVDCTPDFGLRE
jgi:hypothetical protein